MSPGQLERAVARATGESRREIRRRGFQLCPFEVEPEAEAPEPIARVVDWDGLETERLAIFP